MANRRRFVPTALGVARLEERLALSHAHAALHVRTEHIIQVAGGFVNTTYGRLLDIGAFSALAVLPGNFGYKTLSGVLTSSTYGGTSGSMTAEGGGATPGSIKFYLRAPGEFPFVDGAVHMTFVVTSADGIYKRFQGKHGVSFLRLMGVRVDGPRGEGRFEIGFEILSLTRRHHRPM